MRLNQWMTCISAGLMLATNSLSAATPRHEQLQVPQCLAAQMTLPHTVLAEDKEFKIIDLSVADINQLNLLADKVGCGRFVNISHKIAQPTAKNALAYLLQSKGLNAIQASLATHANVYDIKHQETVNLALKDIVADNIWQTLTHLTSFHNRSATKKTGVDAANWLKSEFEALAIDAGRSDTDTFFVKTGWYKQPSLVTVIGKDIKAPAIVLGAHMDTLDGRMPGAGDDGSGSATIMETARVLLNSKTTLKRPIYIIWYAAEELGLVGSQYVVEHFLDHSIPVKAAIQFDMTGYRVDAKDPTMWVYDDYTDSNLSAYVKELIKTYVQVPVGTSKCGYGCSDHASWMKAGVPAAFPCETNFEQHNPYIHSSSDTMELLSLEHMTNFTKLAVAFAIELGSE